MERIDAGDENATGVARAVDEATGRGDKPANLERGDAPEQSAVVLGSGNLGLIYLMEHPHRLALEEIQELHPELIPALCSHPHIGFVLVRSEPTARSRSGRPGSAGSPTAPSPATTRCRGSRPMPSATCAGRTASSTWPTSWSTASTTR